MRFERVAGSLLLCVLAGCPSGTTPEVDTDEAGTSTAATGDEGSGTTSAPGTSTQGSSSAGSSVESTDGSTSTTGWGSESGADTSTGGSEVDYQNIYPLASTYPEGGAFDPVDEFFFVGTLEGGNVTRVDPRDGQNIPFYVHDAPGEWMTLGMAVDADRRRLWVCAADRANDPYTGEVWMFDLDSGVRVEVVPLSASGEDAWCEDVAVASDGTAYATDRENPNIYRIDDSFVSELLVSHDDLGSLLIGQNGIIVLPDDEGLIATIHLPSHLNHISLPDGVVTRIEIEGDFADAGVGSGADGMVYVDGELFVVFDGELARVTPTLADWSAAVSTAVKLPRGLTDVVNTPAGLYLINGQAIGFAFGQDPDPFQLVRFTGVL